MRALLACVSLVLLAGGCIPARFSGYMPTGGKSLEHDHCTSIADIVLVDGGAGIEWKLSVPKGGSPLDLEAKLFIPAGREVRLPDARFEVESADWGQRVSLPIRTWRETDWRASEIASSATLRGERHVYSTVWGSVSSVEEGTWLTAKLAPPERLQNAQPRSFKLHFPEIESGGGRRRAEPVLFEAYSRIGLAGLCN